jgi:hypothetical protein
MTPTSPEGGDIRRKPTEADGKQALRDHVIDKALSARARHGGAVDYPAVLRLLEDREAVRYPTAVAFDAAPLQPGEFAYAEPLGSHPAAGFRLCIHPHFESREEALPLLIAYHIVRINYGDVATREEAELYGAALLGLEVDDYYARLCRLAAELD